MSKEVSKLSEELLKDREGIIIILEDKGYDYIYKAGIGGIKVLEDLKKDIIKQFNKKIV